MAAAASSRTQEDTFLSRVMELPESKYSHWKQKFIDGLPPLFAERVRKAMRGSSATIKWDTFIYGKMIGICTQEGLNLYNDLKLSRQIKMQQMKERAQLGDFCDQFGMKEPFPYRKRTTSRYKKHRDYTDRPYKKSEFANILILNQILKIY